MREIKIAKSAGFCFGVKRAVNLVYDQVGNAKKVYTYGPIIHNEEVVSDLERKGAHVLSEEDIDAMLAHDGREDDAKEIVIRSHGIGRDAYKKLEQLGFEIVDATCPFVKKIHRIVQEETEQGHCVVSGSQLSLIPWNRHKKSLIFLIKMCILSRKRHLMT